MVVVDDINDPGMPKTAKNQRLPMEPLGDAGILLDVVVDDLHHTLRSEVLVARHINFPHAARAQEASDLGERDWVHKRP